MKVLIRFIQEKTNFIIYVDSNLGKKNHRKSNNYYVFLLLQMNKYQNFFGIIVSHFIQ